MAAPSCLALQEGRGCWHESWCWGAGTVMGKLGLAENRSKKVIFIHAALQVKEMHGLLDMLSSCGYNEMHRLCIFILQNDHA